MIRAISWIWPTWRWSNTTIHTGGNVKVIYSPLFLDSLGIQHENQEIDGIRGTCCGIIVSGFIFALTELWKPFESKEDPNPFEAHIWKEESPTSVIFYHMLYECLFFCKCWDFFLLASCSSSLFDSAWAYKHGVIYQVCLSWVRDELKELIWKRRVGSCYENICNETGWLWSAG